jgi:hypothetical protein
MTVKTQLPRYYRPLKDVRKQLSTLLPIVIVFVVTVIYALGLQNETVRTVFLYASLIFPAVIVLNLSYAIPKMSYYQIDSVGVYVTVVGVIHRHIYWSDIDSVGPAVIGTEELIGMTYANTFNRRTWGRKARRKISGWDEVLANAHTLDGTPLGPEVTRYFKKHLRAANRI